MNDDIVVRLRNLSSAQDWETTKYLCADAADEIERLRHELGMAHANFAMFSELAERGIVLDTDSKEARGE